MKNLFLVLSQSPMTDGLNLEEFFFWRTVFFCQASRFLPEPQTDSREEGSRRVFSNTFLQDCWDLTAGGWTLPVQLTETLRSFPVEAPLLWLHPAGRKQGVQEEKVGEPENVDAVGLNSSSSVQKLQLRSVHQKIRHLFVWWIFRVQSSGSCPGLRHWD